MAKTTLSPAQFDREISSLSAEEQAKQDKLESSPGYYSDTASPTRSQLVQDVGLQNIKSAREKLQSQRLSQDWYGPGGTEDTMTEKPREGFLMSSLNALSKPLYGLVGATKYAVGKGQGKNIFETMDQSIKDRETYGTLLRQFDVPAPISAPVGFAMDVIFDPVNILTLGTGGFVGKIGSGAVKAGAEGAAAGARSSFLNGLQHITKFLPEFAASSGKKEVIAAAEELLARGVKETDQEFVNLIKNTLNPNNTWTGRVRELATKASQKVGGLKTAVRTGAQLAETKYGELTGNTIEKILEQRAARLTVGDYARELIGKVPGGEKFLANFDYNPQKWQEIAMMKDRLINFMRENELTLEQVWDPLEGKFVGKGMNTNQLDELLNTVKELTVRAPDDATLIASNDAAGIRAELSRILEKGNKLSQESKGVTRGSGFFENASRMQGEAETEQVWNNLQTALKEMSGNVTGVNAVDKALMKVNNFKVRNVPVGKKLMDTYGKFIGLFKASKLGPLSPASMTYATVGNIAMTHMAGIDITRPEVYKRVWQAFQYLRGKNIAEIGKILETDEYIKNFATEFATTFSREFGFSYAEAMAKNTADLTLQRLAQEGTLLGGLEESQKVRAQVEDAARKFFEESAVARQNIKRSTTPFERAWKEGMPNGPKLTDAAKRERAYEQMAGGSVAPLASELSMKPFIEMRQNIAMKAADGSKVAKAMNWALEQTKHYETIDQSYRLGNFILLTKDGLTANELRHMTGWTGFGLNVGGMKISPADLTGTVTRGGTKYYKIHPEKAAEIVNEIYMNYNAMPAAVRVLRTLPVLGSPFFSFAYAMALKTGKTALVNPSSFNKVNFFLSELEKDKSPLEKEGLKSKYYSWYNKPGMISLPLGPMSKFFEDNPIYMNVANMIPYYSMNMFMPSERKYEEGWNGALASSIDSIPLLKDPIGQLITDYFILPNIIRDSQPQNMWGGPLYPQSASWQEKYLGAPARQLAEATMPSALSALSPLTPEAAIPYLPSYSWRKMANAIRGKTPVGVEANEPAALRSLRAGLSTVGINLYPENLSNLSAAVKKSIKEKNKK